MGISKESHLVKIVETANSKDGCLIFTSCLINLKLTTIHRIVFHVFKVQQWIEFHPVIWERKTTSICSIVEKEEEERKKTNHDFY